MINFDIQTKFDMERMEEKIRRQAPFAGVKAANAMAKEIVAEQRATIARVFDRPRPNTVRSVGVRQYATKANPVVSVAINNGISRTAAESEYDANLNQQGKNAIAPATYLTPQIKGGSRVAKRFERALQRAGLMPAGSLAVFAKRSGALDQYGNLPGPKIVQILSWFQAFPQGGYRMNMTARTKANLIAGKRKGMTHGIEYFRGGKGTGVPDGIWERHYLGGPGGKSIIRPVLIYVSHANYRVRFDYEGIGAQLIERRLSDIVSAELAKALESAR